MKRQISTRFSGYNELVPVSGNLAFGSYMRNFKVLPDGSLKKREGFTQLFSAYDSVDAMWGGTIAGNEIIAAAAGGQLWIYDTALAFTACAGNIGAGRSAMFEFDGKLYILTGSDYYTYNGSLKRVEGYIPLVAVACDPQTGGGTLYEEVNLLTSKRRQRFNTDGTIKKFVITEQGATGIEWVKHNGAAIDESEYSFSSDENALIMNAAPSSAPDSLEICYTSSANSRSLVTSHNCAMIFGGNTDTRVFVWGSASEPCTVRHSALAEGMPSAEYFPENSFRIIGNTPITDIIQQYDRQLIFTKDKSFYSYCELTTDSLGNLYNSYPVFTLNASKGNLMTGGGALMNGCPVTLCDDGLNKWEATDVQDERNAVCFSQAIDSSIKDILRLNRQDSCLLHLHQASGELFFCYENLIYVYGTAAGAWYIYDGIYPAAMCSAGNHLYIGDKFGNVCVLDDSVHDFDATWSSSLCNFGTAGRLFSVTKLLISAKWSQNAGLSVSLTENTGSTTVPIEINGDGITGEHELMRVYRVSARRTAAVRVTAVCPAGKDAEIRSVGADYYEMGDHCIGL